MNRRHSAPATELMPETDRDDPLWYKDAVIYELHVQAFFDSNGDGIGDFRGLTEKLDYLQDSASTRIWLLPFYPSPLQDDGYDIADYHNVHPDYGTLDDFRSFVREAHRRGLRVITDWWSTTPPTSTRGSRRARRAPAGHAQARLLRLERHRREVRRTRGSSSSTPRLELDLGPGGARPYYWHRFFCHQPDLNFDNPAVQRGGDPQSCDFWLDMGVDGFRLDAMPYLFEREGTNCENLPETHAFLKQHPRGTSTSTIPDRMLLAEANQWPEDVATTSATATSATWPSTSR